MQEGDERHFKGPLQGGGTTTPELCSGVLFCVFYWYMGYSKTGAAELT